MLGERLRELRKMHGYSQEQMARKLHVTQGAVSQWENGLTVPAADQLLAIAELYGITVDALLGRETKEPEKQSPDDALRFALYGGDADEITPAQLEEVRRFAQFVRERDKHDGR